MARPKSPDGKHVTMSARFTQAETTQIDIARGHEDRSTFVSRAVLAAVERMRPPAGSADRESAAVAENLAAATGECPHPSRRVNKGLCGACGTRVGKQEDDSQGGRQ
jgi:hypothetical protein